MLTREEGKRQTGSGRARQRGAGDGLQDEGGAKGSRCGTLLREMLEATLLALRTDFWRVCEQFLVRLVLLVTLLLALLELLVIHAKALRGG
jgi:hypothetical protein